MGILLRDKSADFSSNSVGHAGLYTSITTNLKALHELRRSAGKAGKNSAPGMLDGSIFGSPTFTATSMAANNVNGVVFGSRPANGGLTFATVVKIKAGGTASDVFVGINSSGLPAISAGTTSFTLFNRRLSFSALSYPAGTVPPLTGYRDDSAYLDFAAESEGKSELFFGILENGVSLRLYHPKTGNLVTTSAAGRDFCFDNPANVQTNPTNSATTQDQSLFAHWSSVLTPTQMNTFYGEIRAQYALLGLAI